MVSGLYFLTFLASLAAMLTLLLRYKRIMTNMVLLSILVTVNSLGRYLLAVSTTLEMALLSNVMIYVGGCFCPVLLVTLLITFTQVRVPRWMTWGLTAFASVVFFLVLTIGHSDIYYSSVELIRESGFSYLAKEYGPAHRLYPVFMGIICVSIVYVLAAALHHRREIPVRLVSLTVLLGLIIMGSYLLRHVLNPKISYVSLGYLLTMLILMYKIERISMYDLPSNIAKAVDVIGTSAFIEFDQSYHCMGYNQRARELFPEIETQWQIDQKPPVSDSFLYRELILWMYCRKKNEKKTIHLQDQYYELNVQEIPYKNRKCVGYLLQIVDRTSENKYMQAMKTYSADLEREVRKKTENISNMRDMVVVGIASIVESRDDSTGDHIKRTYQAMRTFAEHLMPHARELGMTEEFLKMVTRAAPMHDLGKIAIDDAVLKKQGRFTDGDYEIMKRHPAEGAKIVRKILTGVEEAEFVNIAVNVAHYHHEKWDGTGYPEGLKGEEIPMEGRLMAFPDVFDALVSKRCYKEAMPYDQVFSIIENSLGSHFDPVLGKYFLACRPELEAMYQKWEEEKGNEKDLQLAPVGAADKRMEWV